MLVPKCMRSISLTARPFSDGLFPFPEALSFGCNQAVGSLLADKANACKQAWRWWSNVKLGFQKLYFNEGKTIAVAQTATIWKLVVLTSTMVYLSLFLIHASSFMNQATAHNTSTRKPKTHDIHAHTTGHNIEDHCDCKI